MAGALWGQSLSHHLLQCPADETVTPRLAQGDIYRVILVTQTGLSPLPAPLVLAGSI